MSSGSSLPPAAHASFAVISRLLSCLVTEKLLRAFYLPIQHPDSAKGILVILATHVISEKPILDRVLYPHDIFAIVPLRTRPVPLATLGSKHGEAVGLIDPLDMLPEIYEVIESRSGDLTTHGNIETLILSSLTKPQWELGKNSTLARTEDAVHLWRKFVEGVVIRDGLREVIESELLSSYAWQLKAYQDPPLLPSLRSNPIDWEQSLVAGHPTHPMHRARMLSGKNDTDYDWYQPRVRFARVPRAKLDLIGPFEEQLRSVVHSLHHRRGLSLPADECQSVYVPVHELQIPNIQAKFPDVEIVSPDISSLASAQASIRTLTIPELPGYAVKLSVGVKISSSLRTISHFTTNFGPRFSAEVVPKLAINRDIFAVELETASAVYHHTDPDVAKHFAVVIRQAHKAQENENLIICAALPEMDHKNSTPGVSAVEQVFGLDSEAKRIQFLDRYIGLACEALLPPLLINGVSFEAHAQNLLLRVDTASGQLLGFVVRDLGGLRIHPPTLHESTGLDFAFLPGHCVVTESMGEVYVKFYHTFVHSHLQRLIRILGLHEDGQGWAILRSHMKRMIPENHEAWKVWLGPESGMVASKSLLRMRMQDSYREMCYTAVPNMIQYDGGK